MPKLTEGFSPIAKPLEEIPPVLTNLITPIPIHANNILSASPRHHGKRIVCSITREIFPGILEMENSSTEHSPSISPSRFSDPETCRTIVSLLIHQRKTNLNLEQQLKHLTSVVKPNSIDEHPNHSFSKFQRTSPSIFFIVFFLDSSLSVSTGYSSGSSIDGGSTILSAFSSRSNSSLSERSKTSPISFKPIRYQISTVDRIDLNKRWKTSIVEVRIHLPLMKQLRFNFRIILDRELDHEVLMNVKELLKHRQ